MESTDLSTFIQTHLANPPKPWLRILGTRKPVVGSRHEIPDFDIQIPCSSYTSLFEVELEANPFSSRQRIDIADCQSQEEAIERATRWVCSSLSSEMEWRGLSIHKLVGNYSSSFPLIVARVRDTASRIGYEGHVAVTLHDYFVPEVAEVGDAEEGALLEASWGFNWPIDAGNEAESEWIERIGCAMVRGQSGWVDLNDMEISRSLSRFGYLEKGTIIKESFSGVGYFDGVKT